MKKVVLKELVLSNFKAQNVKVNFGDKTTIKAMNGKGKTTIMEAWNWLLSGFTNATSNKNSYLFDSTKELTKDTPIASVKATICINELEYVIERTARAKFQKVKGSTEYTKSSSDEYKYYVDNVEISASNWDTWLNDNLGSNEMINYLLNGSFFSTLVIEDKKKARDILLKLSGDVREEDFKGDYSCFEPYIQKGYKVDRIEESNKNEKKALEDREKIIPSLIESKESLIAEYNQNDFEAIRNKLKECEKEIKSIDDSILCNAESMKGIEAKRNEVLNKINAKLVELGNEREKYERNESDIKSRVYELECKKKKLVLQQESEQAQRKLLPNKLKEAELLLNQFKEKREGLVAERNEIKSRIFTDSKCAYCGQELPFEMMEEAQEKFNLRKKQDYDLVVTRGKAVAKQIEEQNKVVEDIKQRMNSKEDDSIEKQIAEIESMIGTTKKDYSPFESTDRYKQINQEVEVLKQSMPIMESKDNMELSKRKSILMDSISELNRTLGLSDQVEKLQKDIEGLRLEQREVGNNIAQCEFIIDKCKEYVQERNNIVSQKINTHLNHSYFEMFSTQKDGTIKPDCVLRDSKGVQYATTNTANRMLIDIELQEFFMNHFNVQLPIFIDEAQSFSDENMPEVKGQNILLKVSNDKYLIVE